MAAKWRQRSPATPNNPHPSPSKPAKTRQPIDSQRLAMVSKSAVARRVGSSPTPAPSTNSMTKGHPSGWPFVFPVPEQDAVSPKWRHVHDCALSDPGQYQRLSLLMTFDIVSMLASLHCFPPLYPHSSRAVARYIPVVTCCLVVTGLSSVLAYALLYFGASGLPCTA